MTESQSFALLHAPARAAKSSVSHDIHPLATIHRDIDFADAPFTRPELFAADDSGQLAPLLQIALAALTLPAIAYSLSQAFSLFSGDAMLRAIHTLVP